VSDDPLLPTPTSNRKVASAPGKWLKATIPAAAAAPANGNGAAALLEFVVTDGRGNWDKPDTGACCWW